MTRKVLLLIDLQNDFCRNGNLSVPDGDAVIPLANLLMSQFDLVVATQDWHPQHHMSFASNNPDHQVGDVIILDGESQVLWPDHCVQGSHGAAFHAALKTTAIDKIFQKGSDARIDSYSAFFDNAHKRSTGLQDYLRNQHITDIYLMGLATDYCVKYSCLDALQLGFKVHVIIDACRGVDLNPGDSAQAFQEMKAAGADLVESKALLKLTNQ